MVPIMVVMYTYCILSLLSKVENDAESTPGHMVMNHNLSNLRVVDLAQFPKREA